MTLTRLVQPSVPINAIQLGFIDFTGKVIIEKLLEIQRTSGAELILI